MRYCCCTCSHAEDLPSLSISCSITAQTPCPARVPCSACSAGGAAAGLVARAASALDRAVGASIAGTSAAMRAAMRAVDRAVDRAAMRAAMRSVDRAVDPVIDDCAVARAVAQQPLQRQHSPVGVEILNHCIPRHAATCLGGVIQWFSITTPSCLAQRSRVLQEDWENPPGTDALRFLAWTGGTRPCSV